MGLLRAALQGTVRSVRSLIAAYHRTGRRRRRGRLRHLSSTRRGKSTIDVAVGALLNGRRSSVCLSGIVYVVMATCCLATCCSAMGERGEGGRDPLLPPQSYVSNLTSTLTMTPENTLSKQPEPTAASVTERYATFEEDAAHITLDDSTATITASSAATVLVHQQKNATDIAPTVLTISNSTNNETIPVDNVEKRLAAKEVIDLQRRLLRVGGGEGASPAPSYAGSMLTPRVAYGKGRPSSSLSPPLSFSTRPTAIVTTTTPMTSPKATYPCAMSYVSKTNQQQQQCLVLSDTVITKTCSLPDKQREERLRGDSIALGFCSHVPLTLALSTVSFAARGSCRLALSHLDDWDKLARDRYALFQRTLSKYDCDHRAWGQWPCNQCLVSVSYQLLNTIH